MATTHCKGFIQDPKGHRYTSAERLIAAASPSGATKVDLQPHSPGVLDQKRTSSCVGFAMVAARYVTLRARGIIEPLQSAAWAYKVGLAVDRRSTAEPLRDEGSMPNQVMRGLEEWGSLPATEYPLDERTIVTEPTVFELEKASRANMVGWRSINTRNALLVADLRRALQSGFAPTFAIDVDQAFEDHDGRGELGAKRGPSLGGHEMFVIGYDTLASGQTVFTIQNSWSASWSAGGFARVNEAFVARMMYVALPSPLRAS